MSKHASFLLAACLGAAYSALLFSPVYAQVTKNENNQYKFDEFDFEDKEEEEAPPQAFNPYDKKYRPGSESLTNKTLLPNYFFLGTFLRKPDASADDINMRIISPGTITGCLKQEERKAEIMYRGVEAYIDIGDNNFEIDDETRRYSLYSCKITSNGTEVDLTLSKQDLLANKTQNLIFSRPGIGNYSGLKIEVHPNHITLDRAKTAALPEGVKMPRLANHVEYWYYPDNTLILSDAELKYTPENIKKLEALAQSKGLTLLKDIFTDFDLYKYPKNAAVFAVDEKGIYTQQLEATPNGFVLGHLDKPEVFYGPEGKTTKMMPSPVRARVPGLYE